SQDGDTQLAEEANFQTFKTTVDDRLNPAGYQLETSVRQANKAGNQAGPDSNLNRGRCQSWTPLPLIRASAVNRHAHAPADDQMGLIRVDLNETFERRRFVHVEEIGCQGSAGSVPVGDASDSAAPRSGDAALIFDRGGLTGSAASGKLLTQVDANPRPTSQT